MAKELFEFEWDNISISGIVSADYTHLTGSSRGGLNLIVKALPGSLKKPTASVPHRVASIDAFSVVGGNENGFHWDRTFQHFNNSANVAVIRVLSDQCKGLENGARKMIPRSTSQICCNCCNCCCS